LAAVIAVVFCAMTAVAAHIAGGDFHSHAYETFAILASIAFAIPPLGLVVGLFALRHPYRRQWVGAMLMVHFIALIVSFYYMEKILE